MSVSASSLLVLELGQGEPPPLMDGATLGCQTAHWCRWRDRHIIREYLEMLADTLEIRDLSGLAIGRYEEFAGEARGCVMTKLVPRWEPIR